MRAYGTLPARGAILLVAGLTACHAPPGPPILEARFRRPSAIAGWTLAPLGGEGGAGGGAAAEPGTLTLEQGRWRSPAFPVEPAGYYRVSLLARARAPGWLGLRFYRAGGAEHPADHQTRLDTASDPGTEPLGTRGWTRQVHCFRARRDAVRARLEWTALGGPIEVRRLRVERIDRGRALAWADAVAAPFPSALEVPLPGASWSSLRATRRRLAAGREFRVVLLGDSIMNDIGNGLFATHLERQWPGVRVAEVRSIRSGTGAWYYREPGRVARYVHRHDPDLVILGGISHRFDHESIAHVIDPIRAGPGGPEVLLLSGAIIPGWRTARHERFRRRLAAMAEAMGFAYFDLRVAYDQAVAASGRPPAWFMRDGTHANARGGQLAARRLARHLGP